ncbi:colanic acid/amylovoran biosynthesis protein [Ferrimonas sediminum]|uniref:Colanic acid/amylovoran biosynthesis protein n=1 Tax=Ferrimonas sediminum TaxID=718193 RepID=A0A1G8Z139_9GAMM|nr:polysaccharide pyruvyl transferase family protein [Ferrimonas sediminum]SDK08364.1 colanic acid/amylovoran biosynthesis protein [Ferrimonas sediminum]
MKILIMRASNTMNYGALMMVAIYIAKCKEKNPNASFIVDNVEKNGLNRIKFESGVEEIESFNELGVKLRPDCEGDSNILKLFKYLKYSVLFGSSIKALGVDKVVQLGGDDFSEYYSIKALVIEFIKILSLTWKGINTTLVGQTIGPFRSWRIRLARFVFDKVKIYTRDENCKNYLIKEIGLTNVESSKDLAYLPLPKQGSKDVVGQADLILNYASEYITLVPSGLWKSYTDKRDDYISNWVDLINELHERNEKVMLLAHVISDTSDDRKAIDSILKRLPVGVKDRLIVVDQVISAALARELISRSRLVISGRMHACVSALQTLTPTIPLSYSIKFKGVIGELPVENYIIECGHEELWPKVQLKNKVIDLIDKIDLLDIKDFRERVSSALSEVEIKSAKQII